jgi:hypothetical protein
MSGREKKQLASRTGDGNNSFDGMITYLHGAYVEK